MAVDVQERSQGFILYPKHVNEFPQPVPLANVPAAAGQLPSWEQKKLELEMASANVNGDEEDLNDGHAEERVGQRQPSAAAPAASNQQPLPKQSSLRRTGSAFFSSLRSPSSRSNSNVNGNGTGSNSRSRTVSSNSNFNHTGERQYQTALNGNGSTVKVHHDASGGIGTSPRASSKKRHSSVILYLKKHFGIENHPEYENQRTSPTRSSAPAPSSHAAFRNGSSNKLKKSPSQRLSASDNQSGRNRNANAYNGGSNRKTRSSGFADKMRLASGKMSTKMKQTWRRFNSKSNPEELPSTWEEWRKAYARGEFDVNDLPPPPQGHSRENGSNQDENENPYNQQYLPAPMPEDHRRRQLAFNRLDYEGKRGGIKPSEIVMPAGEEQLPDTLDGHPA